MAYTQAGIDAAKKALESGELTVRFADRTVTYRSIDELQKAINIMEGSVKAGEGTKTRVVLPMTRKGYR